MYTDGHIQALKAQMGECTLLEGIIFFVDHENVNVQ